MVHVVWIVVCLIGTCVKEICVIRLGVRLECLESRGSCMMIVMWVIYEHDYGMNTVTVCSLKTGSLCDISFESKVDSVQKMGSMAA